RLPAYAVPGKIIELDVLPRTASGKVELAALAPPDTGRRPPRKDPESVVLEVWAEVLGEAPPAPDVNFFEWGGESLAAVRLAARPRSARRGRTGRSAAGNRPPWRSRRG